MTAHRTLNAANSIFWGVESAAPAMPACHTRPGRSNGLQAPCREMRNAPAAWRSGRGGGYREHGDPRRGGGGVAVPGHRLDVGDNDPLGQASGAGRVPRWAAAWRCAGGTVIANLFKCGRVCLCSPCDGLFAGLRWRYRRTSSYKGSSADLVYSVIPNGGSGPEIHVE